MNTLLRLPLLLVGFLLGQLLNAQEEATTPIGSLPVPAGLSAEDISKCVAQSFNERSWTIRERSDERVVGYLKQRANEAEIVVTINEDSVDLECWGYSINKRTGERKRPELPNGWINFLKKSITKNLQTKSLETN